MRLKLREIIERIRLKSLIDTKNREGIMDLVKRYHPAEVAQTVSSLSISDTKALIEMLEPRLRAQIFKHLEEEIQMNLLFRLERQALAELFLELPQDERVDLYNKLPQEHRSEFALMLEEIEREDLLKLATYPEGTVGAITTTEYVALKNGMTVHEALELIKKSALDKETIYTLYVVDNGEHLVGTLSLRDLIVADPNANIGSLMRSEPVFIHADQPAEKAAELIRQYDLLALPVVDESGRMLGIVTVDDAMDVAKESELKRLIRYGGTFGGPDLSIRRSSFAQIFGQRFIWLTLLTLLGAFTSAFVARQEEILSRLILLAAFIAPIIDMGGNTGSQAATLVIRAMALGEVRMRWRDFGFVLLRELPVAIALGIVIGTIEIILAHFSKGLGGEILLVVGLSMASVTSIGGMIGVLLPFLARRFGFDPATLSAPVITSIMDIVGLIIYFGLAYAILGINE